MSEGLNRVLLLGNIAADPELRFTQGGQAVLHVRLATNERRKGKDGQWGDHTEFHSVVVWGKRAEALGKILSKGSTIFVEGTLRTTSYEKDGQKVYRTEVNASNVILAGGKSRGDSGEAPRDKAPRGQFASRNPPAESPPADDFEAGGYGGDDDIPF